MPLPKLEAPITIPTGGYVFTLTEASAGYTGPVTIPAGEYFLNSVAPGATRSLLDEIEFQMDAVGRLYTITVDDDADTSTGVVTFRQGTVGVGVTFAVTFTDTALRDILGFTGNISGTYSYTSTKHARYLWLPNCNRSGDHPDPATSQTNFGRPLRDTTQTLAPSGAGTAYFYNTRYMSRIRFAYLRGPKTWKGLEVVVNESFETFWMDSIGRGSRFRYHTSRDTDATYWTLTPLRPGEFPATEHDPAHFSSISMHEIQFETQDYVSG